VLVVTGLAASAILTPGLPPEGGDGMSVTAAVAVVPRPTRLPITATPMALDTDVSYIATLGAATQYYSAPFGTAQGVVPATNPFGTPTVLGVVGIPDDDGWLKVELPIRPNGSTGYIHAGAAALTETTYRVAVNLESRSLTVTNNGQQVLTTPVAVGASNTPTPPGNTYLWELIQPDDPTGPYGPYIFGLAWFSDAYSVFNGGDAQIGIHGNDEPWSIGYAESHGCVRLPNPVISTLAGLLPLGTPVTIS
jgi:lipoprotein-anchoring transpeptidase ErfK/SrfK